MSHADLSFMGPLFDLATSLSDNDDEEDMSMGLGEIHPASALRGDDKPLDGMWVSMVVNNGILAALDHIITLRDLVTRDRGTITVSAPWTLLRATIESAAVSVWVMDSGTRKTRQARALRVWHYDFEERQKWESDTKRVRTGKEKSGATRAADVLSMSKGLGIVGTKVSAKLIYSDVVAEAGRVVGWPREEARARWREASAFAHGRTWPLLALTSPRDAQLIEGGIGIHLALNEQQLQPLTLLAHDLFEGALVRYAELAGQAP